VKTPREVLIVAHVRRSHDYDFDYVQEFLNRHRGGWTGVFTTCSEFTCTHAREYADEVLNSLEAAGYHPVQRDEPAEVNEKLRELLQRRGPLDD
jgi:Tat protein secretion system quality control protein TatD with DNase activity